MPSTTGKSLEELKQMRADLMAQGKQLSTSKSLGKVEQAIKVANPSGYGADQVSSAQQNLKLINEPTVSGMPGATGTQPTTTSDLSALESQLSAKQDALTKATKNVNDNPWYSEATRVGKLAKLNNIAQLEIGNIQSQIAQQKQDEQNAKQNATANLRTVTNDAGDVSIYDLSTGKVVNTIKGVGNAQNTSKADITTVSKYRTGATNIFKDVDKSANELNPNATEDKKLSAGEQYMILQRIKALVGGDEKLAAQVFQDIWDLAGYDNYGG